MAAAPFGRAAGHGRRERRRRGAAAAAAASPASRTLASILAAAAANANDALPRRRRCRRRRRRGGRRRRPAARGTTHQPRGRRRRCRGSQARRHGQPTRLKTTGVAAAPRRGGGGASARARSTTPSRSKGTIEYGRCEPCGTSDTLITRHPPARAARQSDAPPQEARPSSSRSSSSAWPRPLRSTHVDAGRWAYVAPSARGDLHPQLERVRDRADALQPVHHAARLEATAYRPGGHFCLRARRRRRRRLEAERRRRLDRAAHAGSPAAVRLAAGDRAVDRLAHAVLPGDVPRARAVVRRRDRLRVRRRVERARRSEKRPCRDDHEQRLARSLSSRRSPSREQKYG